MLTRNKILSHAILILLLVSAFPLFLHVGTENASADSPEVWNQTSGALASTNANWLDGTKPIAGDNVIFNATSTASCTWDLDVALGTFSILTGYSGTITQTANFSVISFYQVAGIFTASVSYTVTDLGDFIQTDGVFTHNKMNLKMFSGNINVGLVDLYLNSLEVVGDVVVNGYTQTNHLTIGMGATVDLALGGYFYWHPATAAYIYSNQGTITGISPFTIWLTGGFIPSTYPLGNISCPFSIERTASTQGGSPPGTFILASDTHLGNSFNIMSYNSLTTMTVNTGNFDLSATSITVGTRGVLNGGTSDITCSDYWNSSSGTFIQGSSVLKMDMDWTANANGVINFTVPNLETGRIYKLYIDGTWSMTQTASNGAISFSYSSWSIHQFEIVPTSVGPTLSGMVNLIFIIVAVGIVVGVVVESTYSVREKRVRSLDEMASSLIDTVIYIVIGIAGLGVLYSIVA